MRTIDRVVKGSTKAGQALISRALEDIGYNLHEVYGSFSRDKYNAWSSCIELMHKLNGSNFAICSKNTFGFTCSFVYYEEGEHVLVYCTKDHTYKIYTQR